MNKNQIVKVVVFCFAFICLASVGCEAGASQMLNGDTLDLAIGYNTAYPDRFVEIAVLMKNPVPISSFAIYITLGGWDLINFTTDSIYIDSVYAPIDTCPDPDTVCTIDTCSCGGGEPDTCACFEWHKFPVRECYLDTAGSLVNDFETITCHGDTGDTSLPDCKVVTVYGYAGTDSLGQVKYIPPRGNYATLFKLGVDLSCLCDSDSGRNVLFLVSQGFSNFSDELGYTVPFRYQMGELFAWWSVPGDANNDSSVNSADLVFLINYLFSGGPFPCIPEAGDVDSSCTLNSADIVYLINYLYGGGPAPKRGCYCPLTSKVSRLNEECDLMEELNLKPLFERR